MQNSLFQRGGGTDHIIALFKRNQKKNAQIYQISESNKYQENPKEKPKSVEHLKTLCWNMIGIHIFAFRILLHPLRDQHYHQRHEQ